MAKGSKKKNKENENYILHLIVLFYEIVEKFVLKQVTKAIWSKGLWLWSMRGTVVLTQLMWVVNKLSGSNDRTILQLFFLSVTITHLLCIAFSARGLLTKTKGTGSNADNPVVDSDPVRKINQLLKEGTESDSFYITRRLCNSGLQFEAGLKEEVPKFEKICDQFRSSSYQHVANLEAIIDHYREQRNHLLAKYGSSLKMKTDIITAHKECFIDLIAKVEEEQDSADEEEIYAKAISSTVSSVP